MNELTGVIPILKPSGMTSHDVVAGLRRRLGIKKIGHTGTLDPAVTGVLPVLIGSATRLSDYFMSMPKTYVATAVLGSSTDTQDATGTVTASSDASHVRRADVLQTLESFCGSVEQIPPDYSAVKIGGRTLLDYTLRGEKVPEKSARNVRIFSMDLLSFDHPEFTFRVECSKGTYVRTICHDVGEKLGVHAHMKSLVRTGSGGFILEEAVKPDDVSAARVLPIRDAVLRLNTIERMVLPNDKNIVYRLDNGIRFDLSAHAIDHPRSTFTNHLKENDDGNGKNEKRVYFVFVEDCFYGIADEHFYLIRRIRDSGQQ